MEILKLKKKYLIVTNLFMESLKKKKKKKKKNYINMENYFILRVYYNNNYGLFENYMYDYKTVTC